MITILLLPLSAALLLTALVIAVHFDGHHLRASKIKLLRAIGKYLSIKYFLNKKIYDLTEKEAFEFYFHTGDRQAVKWLSVMSFKLSKRYMRDFYQAKKNTPKKQWNKKHTS